MTDAALDMGDNIDDNTPPEDHTPSGNWRVQAGIEDESLDKFESVADLAKSYREMEAYRSNSLRIPSQEAGEEAWAEFNQKLAAKVPELTRLSEDNMDNVYSQLGRPKDASEYKFSEVPGFDADAQSQKDFMKVAHSAGLSNKQADEVHKWLAENITNESMETTEQQEADMAQLKTDWGVAFDVKLNQAQSAVNSIETIVPGFKEYLNKTGNHADPMFIRTMAALADQFGEKMAGVPATPDGIMTPDEARMQISDIRNNADHPYNNELDPGHDAAKRKVMSLYRIANGTHS